MGTDLYSRDFVLSGETEPTALRETGLGAVLQCGEARVVSMVGRCLAPDWVGACPEG